MTAGNLLAATIFSAIGLGALIYGWRNQRWKAFSLGIALSVFPCFFAEAWKTTVVGVALTAALFVFRD